MNIYQALNRAGKKGWRIEFCPLWGTNAEAGKVCVYADKLILTVEDWDRSIKPQAAALKALRAADNLT